MSRKKNYYYVLVFTESGPKYVTKINGFTKDAHWSIDDKPLAMSKDNAEYLALGLTWNGHHSVMVHSTYEIESHPYNYSGYKIEWVKREEEK